MNRIKSTVSLYDAARDNKIKENTGTILTSRARLARNISGFRFSSMIGKDEKITILNIVKDIFKKDDNIKHFKFYPIKKISRPRRKLFIEKHLISQEMCKELDGKAVFFDYQSKKQFQAISILINEEDHLRIQCVKEGMQVRDSFREVEKVNKIMEGKLNFSFDKKFGYLTACPTNLGTTLRVSVLVHLPCLVNSSKIKEFADNLNKVGYNIRGYFGENSDIIGNLFQISNNGTLGMTEDEIVEEMEAICLNIVEKEHEAKYELLNNDLLAVEDSIYRSYGMIKYAKILSFEEAVEIMSMLKLGLSLNFLKGINDFNLYESICSIGDSNITLNLSRESNIDRGEIEKIRADYLREKILKKD